MKETIEEEAVRFLYWKLLGRSVDADGLRNCVSFLRSGNRLADLILAIESSEEYATKHAVSESAHPLAHLKEVYSQENISFFTYRGKYRPLSLMIETVNICNNDCIICPYSSQTRKKQQMSMTLFSKIVSDYVEIGGGPVGLTPMVGEIFLDKSLPDRLKILREAPTIGPISAITNASMVHLFSDSELEELLGYFDTISISVYGLDPEEYLLMTRKPNYQYFFDGLVRILRIKGPESVNLSARQLKKRSANEVRDWLEQLASFAKINSGAIRFSATSKFANWSFFDTRKSLPLDAEWLGSRENEAQCALPLVSAQVLSDGTTSFCGCANFDGVSELNLGNIKYVSLKDMMASPRVQELWNWKKHGTPEFCKTCTFHVPIGVLSANKMAFEFPLTVFGG